MSLQLVILFLRQFTIYHIGCCDVCVWIMEFDELTILAHLHYKIIQIFQTRFIIYHIWCFSVCMYRLWTLTSMMSSQYIHTCTVKSDILNKITDTEYGLWIIFKSKSISLYQINKFISLYKYIYIYIYIYSFIYLYVYMCLSRTVWAIERF